VCCDVPLYVLVSLARALAHVPLRAVLLCALGGAAPAHIIYMPSPFVCVYQSRSFQAATGRLEKGLSHLALARSVTGHGRATQKLGAQDSIA
jgi:hypothetical protein